MAKETKEERKARLQAEEEARIAQEAEVRAEFLAGLPKRLMDAQALASDVGIRTSVTLTETGPLVEFYSDDHEGDYIDYQLTYQCEEWEIESLESSLRGRKEKIDAARARQALAVEVFSKLSKEEQTAVKEFIYMLR